MWDAFFEHLRERGRSANLFFLIIVAIAIGAFFGWMGMAVLLGLLATYLSWFCLEAYRRRARMARLGRQPLNSIDLRMARTKLANSKTQRLLNEQSQRLRTQRMARPTAGPLRLRRR